MTNHTETTVPNPLAPWIPSGDAMRGWTDQAKNVQSYFADLQQRYAKMVQEQIALMASSNEKIARAVKAFAMCKQPQDFVDAEAGLTAALLEVGERCTKHWVDFARDAQAAWSETLSKETDAG